MVASDRDRWNEKYRRGSHSSTGPSPWLVEVQNQLPTAGRALDVAGGAGGDSLWLARRGLEVVLADVSDEALRIARQRAASHELTIETKRLDLEVDPFPAGPWRLISCSRYLQRSLFAGFAGTLEPAGVVIFEQPTVRNLERHKSPSRRFLLEEGELRGLAESAGLRVVRCEEGWHAEQHTARLLARG